MSKSKKKQTARSDDICIDPEQRLVNKFDSVSIAKFPVAKRDKMGFRVVDDCAEEHRM